MRKSYEQFCPIATGLDVLGDRWTLLIVRELAIGDQRFTDLRTHLPGIAPNLLSERLRQLVADGLAEQVELPPPAARSVYRLTDDGRRAVPVLRAMARFGAARLPASPPPGERSLVALLVPWSTRSHAELATTVTTDGVPWHVRRHAGGAAISPGRADNSVCSFKLADLAATRRTGAPLPVEGATPAASEFAKAFELELVDAG
jgi:DNA-binding HxlR family transcriptional regulator